MVTRIGGLASGMDIDSIVKDLMTAERMPVDKLKQKKQTLEWQRDEYRSMNTLLLDFRSTLTQMKLTSKYRASKAVSSDDTKVTATASSAAAQSSYSITQVDKLATAARQTAASIGKVDANKALGEQTAAFSQPLNKETETFTTAPATWQLDKTGLAADGFKISDGTSTYTYNSATGALENSTAKKVGSVNLQTGVVTFDKPTDWDNKTVTAEYKQTPFAWKTGGTGSQTLTGSGTNSVSLALPAGVQLQTAERGAMTVKVNGTAYEIVSAPGDLADNKVLMAADGTLTFNKTMASTDKISVDYITNEAGKQYADFSIQSHTSKGAVTEKFLVQSTDTLNQVISKVNASTAGVTMFYDSFSGGFSMTRNETGNYNAAGKEMAVTGDFATKMLQLGGAETGGENAQFTINGLSTERQSNTFDMNGVSITLKKTFTAAEGAATLSVNKDAAAVYDNIKDFVDKYNTLIEKISAKTSEERYRTYTPLTDEQRETLSDKQQEQWEEKAKSGLLRRDSILTGALTSMRSNFSQPVSNSETNAMYNQLSEIGITTTSNYLEGGKLQINETKLKEALAANPDAVEALFKGGSGETAEASKGIIHRLSDSVTSAMDKLKTKAGNSFSTNQQFALGRQLSNVDSSITRFEARLIKVEDRYWRQFTAMEKAIQQANSQSMYLMQQFSS